MSLPPFPTNTREQIEEIIGMIGRDVQFNVIASSIPCTICTLDPVTNTSTDSFCPVCSGDYWIPVISGVMLSGHITWKFDYENQFETGGRILIGDARVKVMFTPENEAVVKNSESVVVDGRIMDIIKTTLLGAKQINRIIVDLKEREE